MSQEYIVLRRTFAHYFNEISMFEVLYTAQNTQYFTPLIFDRHKAPGGLSQSSLSCPWELARHVFIE